MLTFESLGLWRRTLAPQSNDQHQEERERLRSALLSFRERAALLAAEIARDLPDYTVHDVTHLDALWQMADLISGPSYELTATEAFVLGGAFLVHDLGNGLAAYPDGIRAMYASATWNDSLSLILRRKLGRVPTATELGTPDDAVRQAATAQALRAMHAQHAERLALVSWLDPHSGSQLFLIQDEFLRNNYGRLIGRIAHSHWWNVDKLRPEFDSTIGAPVTCPAGWTVDPLKIACLLRVADAAHLDARRAPTFLKAIRHPSAGSLDHWNFQEKLQQPMQSGDRLIYSSAQHFTQGDAPAWWLCFDALKALDSELAGTDAVLADCFRERFAIRGIQGAEDALRLSRWIKTENWSPVDTKIKVSNVAELASRLGGAQLYGDNYLVPMRELIQNAADAIRARKYLERRSQDDGTITVRLGEDNEGHWIEVADNGIGMSENVLAGSLLDFGSPFWNSDRMVQELPGLASTGFNSTGRYGIGFFSLFMWGSHVRVISRCYRDAVSDTRVLEFEKGLDTRPILRKADKTEYLPEGGTEVRIWVRQPPESEHGVFASSSRTRKKAEDICEWLCPAIDVNLYVERVGTKGTLVVGASDWKTIDGLRLLKRLFDNRISALSDYERLMEILAPNLAYLMDRSGNTVGRAAVVPAQVVLGLGAVTDGGLRACGMDRIAGILQGLSTTASRDGAIPNLELSVLSEWASKQRHLIEAMPIGNSNLAYAADTISRCGGSIGRLPVALTAQGWLSTEEVQRWSTKLNEIIVVENSSLSMIERTIDRIELNANVAVCQGDFAFFLRGSRAYPEWPDHNSARQAPFRNRSTQTLVARTIAAGWSVTLEEVLAASLISYYPNFRQAVIGTIGGKAVSVEASTLINPQQNRTRGPRPACAKRPRRKQLSK